MGKITRRQIWFWAWLALAMPGYADEESFPEKPIQVIVPFAAGGGSDTFARIIQQAVREHALLPYPFVIQNVPDAGGTIGSRRALHADPDGYTILFLHEGILTARVSGQATWGPEDFAPIAATGEVGAIIAVARDSPIQTLDELLSDAAETPDEITFGSNVGAPSHFWALLLENAKPGAQFRYVQTGGGATRFAALKGGHVSASAFSVAEYLAFREGGIRALAFLGENRHPALPEISTARESGIEVLAGNIQCWWAPKGTPPERVAVLADALRKALETPAVRQRLEKLQIDPVFLTGEPFDSEIEKRRAAVSAVAHRAIEGLPDVPLFLMIAAAITGLWLLISRVRSKRVESPTQQGLTRIDPGKIHGAAIAGMTIAFAGILAAGWLPFPISCSLFVLAAGWLLTPNRPTRKQIAGFVVFAALLGFGIQSAFSRFFSIDLP